VDSAIQSHYLYYTIWSYYRGIPDFIDLHNGVPASNGTSYRLRPEFLESNYYLYTATQDIIYLEVAEKILEDIGELYQVQCGF